MERIRTLRDYPRCAWPEHYEIVGRYSLTAIRFHEVVVEGTRYMTAICWRCIQGNRHPVATTMFSPATLEEYVVQEIMQS